MEYLEGVRTNPEDPGDSDGTPEDGERVGGSLIPNRPRAPPLAPPAGLAGPAASSTILVYYGIANVAALRMPRQARLYSDVIPWVGVLSCGLLDLSLAPATIGTGIAVLAAGFGLRGLARARARPDGS